MNAPALLVDTNVWLDSRLERPGESDASRFVVYALSCGARLGIAAHSLKDLFILMERNLKRMNEANPAITPEHAGRAARAAAWATVELMLEHVEVVGSDYMDALLATKYRHLHDFYEDNLVVSAAERMKADALVTNDQKLLRHAPVNAMTPATAIAWLDAHES